jgi:hypothetical protein
LADGNGNGNDNTRYPASMIMMYYHRKERGGGDRNAARRRWQTRRKRMIAMCCWKGYSHGCEGGRMWKKDSKFEPDGGKCGGSREMHLREIG